jgi:hypothetical protein
MEGRERVAVRSHGTCVPFRDKPVGGVEQKDGEGTSGGRP